MSDFLKVFEAKALAEELTAAGHSVSERTAQRWKAGKTKPKPQDIRAIRDLIGATLPDTKNEPPDPSWVGRLETKVDAIPTREYADGVGRAAAEQVIAAVEGMLLGDATRPAADSLVGRVVSRVESQLEALGWLAIEDPDADAGEARDGADTARPQTG